MQSKLKRITGEKEKRNTNKKQKIEIQSQETQGNFKICKNLLKNINLKFIYMQHLVTI